MPGIDVTDPRLLAIQQATRGMDPQQAAGYLQKVADSGTVPGSLAYLMSMYQKVKALEGMTPPSQGPAGPMPTVKDQLEAKLGSGIASVPAPNLERPDTFAGGGIVAFADSGYVAGGASSGSRSFGGIDNDLLQEGWRNLQGNVGASKQEEYALARQNLEARKRQRDITKEEKNYLDSQIKQLDNERKRTKGEFFVEAGANLASSNRPFIGALASSFKDPAGKYASGIRGLMDKEMAIKKESIAADLRDAGYDVEDADRMAAAQLADQQADAAARGELGKAQISAALDMGKLQAEYARINALTNEAAMRRDATPWMSFKPDAERWLAEWQDAVRRGDGKAAADAKGRFDKIMQAYQSTLGGVVAAGIGAGSRERVAMNDLFDNAAPQLNPLLRGYAGATSDERRQESIAALQRALQNNGIPPTPDIVARLLQYPDVDSFIRAGGASGAGAGADVMKSTLVPDDPETEARFGLGPP